MRKPTAKTRLKKVIDESRAWRTKDQGFRIKYRGRRVLEKKYISLKTIWEKKNVNNILSAEKGSY